MIWLRVITLINLVSFYQFTKIGIEKTCPLAIKK